MVVSARSGQSSTTAAANNNNNTKKERRSHDGTAAKFSNQSTDKKRGRRRKRRPAIPPDFENWQEEDKKAFKEVNQLMKHWKATQRQCEPIISSLKSCSVLRARVLKNPMHSADTAEFENVKKAIPVIGKDDTFDWERS